MGIAGVLFVLFLVLSLVGLPALALVRRFRANEESVAGGSMGRQYLRRNDDWGPKPTKGV